MTGAATLEVGKGFGTWLIPIIIFGVLGSVAFVSLITLVCVYSCRSRRRTTDQDPEMTYETYRTPTISYKDPSHDRPIDPIIGRLIRHSRSLHVPRNQPINGRSLRPQVSFPELRNASRPPPYTYQTTPSFSPYRGPRPHGQVYSKQIFNPGDQYRTQNQPQQLAPPPVNLPARPERCFSVSSPSSYSSSCISAEAFSPPSTPSIFSQESFVPVRNPSWVDDSPKHRDSDSDSADSSSLLTRSSHNEHSAISSIIGSYGIERLPVARPRHRPETNGIGRSGQNNRRLIVVDSNLVSRDSEVSLDRIEVQTLRRVEVSRLVKSTLRRRAEARADEGETKEAKKERIAVLKVICPDTSDLWKMPVIHGESLDVFAGRVKRKAGGDVVLFMDDKTLANEEDWRAAAKGGGRLVARLIR